MPAVVPAEAEVGRRIADAVVKVRRQKQRPTAERIRHMLERCGDAVTSCEVDQLLDLAVNSGAVQRIYNPSGVVSYKDNCGGHGSPEPSASSAVMAETCVYESRPKKASKNENLGNSSDSSIVPASEPLASSVVTETHLSEPKPKKASKRLGTASIETHLSPEPKLKKASKPSGSASAKTRLSEPKLKAKKSSESKKSETKKSDSLSPSKKANKKQKPPLPLQHSPQLSNVFHETVSADFKPALVVDKHTDLSDVVLQVIVRLGSASGKVLEKDIRSHYRLDVYPGSDIRRLIRAACKSLVRRERLRQDGNCFVLRGDDDDDDADDVTLMVDEPQDVGTENMSIDTQVCLSVCMSVCLCLSHSRLMSRTTSALRICPFICRFDLYRSH